MRKNSPWVNLCFYIAAILAAFPLNIGIGLAQTSKEKPHWYHSNGTYKSEKFSSLSSIKSGNLSDLEPAWVFYSGFVTKTSNTVQSPPIFTGSNLVTVSLDGSLIAINPETGIEKWRTNLAKPVGRRGIIFKQLGKPTLFVPTGKGVVAINELTGAIDKSLGINGIFGTELSLFPPIVTKKSVIVAHNWTGVKSYDLKTGEEQWNAVIKSGNVTPRIWAGYSFDETTGLLFIVTSNPGGLIGVKRNPVKDYSSSLVAVDSDTGKIVWSFQEITHDLWDLEMVGSPIIADIELYGKIKKAVFAFSKTGNVIALDRLTGKPIYPNSYRNVAVAKSDVPGENSSSTQKLFSTPEPISKTIFDPKKELQNISGKRRDYIDFKMRNAKTGFFVPPSLNNSVVLFGLHGGAEWPGGALDKINNQLIVPSNRNPWILRLYYTDNIFSYINKKLKEYNFNEPSSKAPPGHKERLSGGEKCSSCHSSKARWDHGDELSVDEMSLGENIYGKLSYFSGNGLYVEKCASCHGVARQGFYEHEFFGDGYAPSLVGITLTKRKKSLSTLKKFVYNHKYTSDKIELSQSGLEEIRDYFASLDKFLNRWNLLTIRGKWQLLLDQDNLPAVSAPWGELTAINLTTGKINWKKPFGQRKISDEKEIVKGDISFGGVLVTAGGLIFATGTPDEMIRAFNSKTGEELWSYKLPAAGSAPPMTYFSNGCQYVVVNATGGRFVGYGTRSDATVAFKLTKCRNEK